MSVDRPTPGQPIIINGPVNWEVSPEARMFGNIVMWFLVLLVLGSAAGIWIKVFWMGWVLVP